MKQHCLSTAHHDAHTWGTDKWCPGFDASDEDPRIEKLAQFMQARDARTYEVYDSRGILQTWATISEFGREEYMKDAKAYVEAMDIINKGVDQ